MKIYEGMFVLDDTRANEQWDAVAKEVRGLLEKNQAEVFSCDRWDERRLAYPIQGHTRAVYLLARFTAPGEAIAALERDCALNETILRLLVVRDIKNEKLLKQGLYDPRADAKAPQSAAAEKPPAEDTKADAGDAPAPAPEPEAAPEAQPAPETSEAEPADAAAEPSAPAGEDDAEAEKPEDSPPTQS